MRTTHSRRAAVIGCALLGAVTAACGSSVPGQAGPVSTTSTATSPTTIDGVVSTDPAVTTSGPVPTPVTDGLVVADVARMQPGDGRTAGSVVSAVGSHLFRDTRTPSENSVISPYSIYAALAMTEAGAGGNTDAQLQTFLGDPDPAASVTAVDAAIAEAVRESNEGLPTGSTAKGSVVESANSLWAQEGLAVKPDYLAALGAGFGTGMFQTDFAGDAAGSRDRINGWVGERTHDLIPELLGTDDVSDQTKVVLVNALYLSAQWDKAFHQTAEGDFHGPDGQAMSVPMMSASGSYGYASGTDWESVSIPYRGDGLAMTIILPAEGKFEKVAGSFDADLLAAATAGDSSGKIDLTLPPFTAGSRADLAEPLIGAGVTDLFDPGTVDLSGVTGEPGELVVTKVIHQAIVEVDENGTTAAAATAITAESGSAPNPDPPKEFVVDRPFFFVIHDTTTNAPLFLGQIVNPTKS